jgi:hypothetical protein
MPSTVVEAVLPALSAAVPLTDWSAPSSDTVARSEHEATPDVASEHENDTVATVLYQPLAFGAGDTDPEILGSVASRWMATDTGPAEPPALVAEHPYTVLD